MGEKVNPIKRAKGKVGGTSTGERGRVDESKRTVVKGVEKIIKRSQPEQRGTITPGYTKGGGK